MALTPKQRSFLRGQAHHLKPVVMIGKEGLTPALFKSLYDALRSHELVKIKIPAESQEDLKETTEAIFEECVGVEKVQTIGHLLVVFRATTPPGKVSKALKEAKIPYVRSQKLAAESSEEE